jgi:hypothetical protein
LSVDLFARADVDEPVEIARAAAGTARVERCEENG